MNDKAKKVLSYVTCAIGGACLGIALLGGLSYCSTSSAREKTDTINTIDRVRHNEQITTSDGGYTGYSFTLNEEWSATNALMNWRVYDVNPSNYELTSVVNGTRTAGNSQSNTKSIIQTIYNDYIYSGNDALRFLAVWQRADWWGNGYLSRMAYFSFILPNGQSTTYSPKAFTKIGWDDALGVRFDQNYLGWGDDPATPYFVTYEQSNIILIDMRNQETDPVSSLTFQDVESYYKSQGYEDGYADGRTMGNSEGYSSGYNNGYEAGSSAGYESGYDQGFQEGYTNTYYAFTSLIVNRNAIWNMANIPWHSNNDIYVASGHLNDYPFLDPAKLQTNTYVNWAYLALFRDTATLIPYWIYAQRYTTSQNNGYVSFVIRISPADQTSTENAGNIGSYSGGVSLSATSIFQTETVTEWTAPNRCQLIAFGSEDPRDIYRDWFDNGYILPRGIAVDENAYEQGYKQGQLDAQRNTSMNNVFALFTPAFGAVASFFDMKIFGFLPLYWFLIAPLFIALISLIMRMVKH